MRYFTTQSMKIPDEGPRSKTEQSDHQNTASAGSRTLINCLEGSYAYRYTTDALSSRLLFYIHALLHHTEHENP